MKPEAKPIFQVACHLTVEVAEELPVEEWEEKAILSFKQDT